MPGSGRQAAQAAAAAKQAKTEAAPGDGGMQRFGALGVRKHKGLVVLHAFNQVHGCKMLLLCLSAKACGI